MDTSKKFCEPLHQQSRLYIGIIVFLRSSSLRNQILLESQIVDEVKIQKLKDWSPSRMQHFYLAGERIMELYYHIIEALKQLQGEDGGPQALGYINQLTNPRTVALVLFLQSLGNVIVRCTRFLDRTNLLICEVNAKIKQVITSIDKLEQKTPVEEKIWDLLDKKNKKWGFQEEHLFDIKFPRGHLDDDWDRMEAQIAVIRFFSALSLFSDDRDVYTFYRQIEKQS